MKQLDIWEIHKVQLELLKKFHSFCEQNNLKYSLTFGSLLGAVRHNGFIPWDDDVDILMNRNDYEFFVNNFSDPDSNLRIITKDRNIEYKLPFAKLVDSSFYVYEYTSNICSGIWIDIFPYDNVPDNECERIKFFNKIHSKQKHYDFYRNIPYFHPRAIWKKMIIFFLKRIHNQKLENILYFKLEKCRKKYCSIATKNVALTYKYFEGYGVPFAPRNLIEETELHQFENLSLYIPSNYDVLLKAFYDDYLILPDIENRKSKHFFTALKRINDVSYLMFLDDISKADAALNSISNANIKSLVIIHRGDNALFDALKVKYNSIDINFIDKFEIEKFKDRHLVIGLNNLILNDIDLTCSYVYGFYKNLKNSLFPNSLRLKKIPNSVTQIVLSAYDSDIFDDAKQIAVFTDLLSVINSKIDNHLFRLKKTDN